MNLTSLITDNITEILIKIVKFTQSLQKILVQNIINIHNPGFVPKELVLDMLVDCIVEHVGELIHFQIFRHESGIVDVDYVLDEDLLARLRALDYLNEYFSDVVRY